MNFFLHVRLTFLRFLWDGKVYIHDKPSPQSSILRAARSILSSEGSGYLRSAFSSRNSIQRFRNLPPLLIVSESPMTTRCLRGRVIATVKSCQLDSRKSKLHAGHLTIQPPLLRQKPDFFLIVRSDKTEYHCFFLTPLKTIDAA